MSERVFWAGQAMYVVAVAFVVTHTLLSPWPGVTEQNVARIQRGMTLREVEGILGGPAKQAVSSGAGGPQTHSWLGERGIAIVQMDTKGRVEAAGWLARPRGTAR